MSSPNLRVLSLVKEWCAGDSSCGRVQVDWLRIGMAEGDAVVEGVERKG